MQAGRQRSSALRIGWAAVLILQGEWGSEKPASSFLGRVRCVFKSAEGWSSDSRPGSESGCSPPPIPLPRPRGSSRGSTQEASLSCADGFFSAIYLLTGISQCPLSFPRYLWSFLPLGTSPGPTPNSRMTWRASPETGMF